MSYQVLARKYRPQLFGEVVGQAHVTQTLQNALTSNRIHHAYLFTGARGIGKTTVARILAKALNCEKGVLGQGPALPGRKANSQSLRSIVEPCDQCPNCLDIIQGKSLDVHEIDGASNTSVEDVREIREQVKYLPAKGRYKIYIIDEVHMLSTSAFNALLKTLEEPPPHVIFIFATTEVHKIPATILSRCQRYDFRRIPTLELVASLKKLSELEKAVFEEDALHLIAHEAQGSLRDAQSLLDQAIAFAGSEVRYDDLKKMFGFLDRAQLWDLLKSILEKDRQGALNRLNEFYQSGSDLNRLAQDILNAFRNLLLIRSLESVPAWLDLPKEELATLQTLSGLAEVQELDQLFSIAYRGAEDIARAAFPKMVFEVLLIRMTQVTEIVPLNNILERLEKLQGAPMPVTTEPRANKFSTGVGERVIATPIVTPPTTAKWSDFEKWVQKEKPQLASILSHGQMVKYEEKSVTLQFEKASVYGEMLQEEDRKRQLQDTLTKFFGKPLSLQIIFSEKTISADADNSKSQTKVLREQALKHEAVREATNIFGAVIEEVKTDLD
ncbi:MAG: DNA polymerase III, subunit gamma and tau [Deltaproteobacteria bacterium RIFCSPLOWO2_02_FULL_46_8]|nr:MAG: DNA polymerase III, subunit gamma and tau [Deltaproteobacteria bacterium RIFCSPLOWO2_02_FULL_46_8]